MNELASKLKDDGKYQLRVDNITKSFLIDAFSTTNHNKEPLVKMNEKIILDLEKFKDNPIINFPNINDIKETTYGRLVVNIFIFDIPFNLEDPIAEPNDNLINHINFVNIPITKKVAESIGNNIADLLFDNIINTHTVEEFVNRLQWLGYTCASFTLPSLDLKTVNPSKTIRAKRDKILKDNAEVINSKNVSEFSKLEKEILDFASEELDKEGATGKLIYNSGFNGDFSNNYKVTSIFRGIAPKSDNNNKFDIATSNLVDGVSKEDLASHIDLAVLGSAGRAKDTQLGGYKTKIFNAAFASIVADNVGTDCKTTGFEIVDLTNDNFKEYQYRFIIDKGENILLNKNNKAKYIDRSVKMRSPLYCTSDKICHKCLGDRMRRLGIRNIGLNTSRVTASLMNASMKSFHNMSVKPKEYNLIDYITSD